MYIASPEVIRSSSHTMKLNYLLNETGESFSILDLHCYLICVSLDLLLYLTINHSMPVEKWHLELNLWPWTLTFELDLELWPWRLTSKQIERQQNVISKHVSSLFDLAQVKVNSHAKNQGRRSNCSSVRVIADGRTDGLTLPTYYIQCFAVDNKFLLFV